MISTFTSSWISSDMSTLSGQPPFQKQRRLEGSFLGFNHIIVGPNLPGGSLKIKGCQRFFAANHAVFLTAYFVFAPPSPWHVSFFPKREAFVRHNNDDSPIVGRSPLPHACSLCTDCCFRRQKYTRNLPSTPQTGH